MNVYEKLQRVQHDLKCNKSQYNSFGKYNYRNCEDILEAVKPLCNEVKALVLVGDTLELIGERYYIKATATFVDIETGEKIESAGYAREEDSKKGMDSSQVTGATSSYARKYALNGLLCIDDTKDADSTDNPSNKKETTQEKVFKCTKCGKEITAFDYNGTHFTEQQAYVFAVKRGNGVPVCGVCAKK